MFFQYGVGVWTLIPVNGTDTELDFVLVDFNLIKIPEIINYFIESLKIPKQSECYS